VSTVGTLQKGDFVVLDIEAADKMKPTACALSLATAVIILLCGASKRPDRARAKRRETRVRSVCGFWKAVSCGAMLLRHVALLCAWVCGCVVL
jgi:hypothetical protein